MHYMYVVARVPVGSVEEEEQRLDEAKDSLGEDWYVVGEREIPDAPAA